MKVIGIIFLPIAIGRIDCKIPRTLALEVAAKLTVADEVIE